MDITSAAWRSLCNPLPRFSVWNRTLGAFRPVLQRAERLMCFWRWWQIQSLDFTWLNEERNSVMHQRKRPSFSPELSQAWGHYVNHTLSPSESWVKTCHSKYLSPILGLFLREAAFFEKKKKMIYFLWYQKNTLFLMNTICCLFVDFFLLRTRKRLTFLAFCIHYDISNFYRHIIYYIYF